VATLNIYIPGELKAEMDAHSGMNWSSVAQAAIRSALTERKAATMNTEAIAERLKSTAGKNSTYYKHGVKDGQEWMATIAELDDIESLLGLDIDQFVDRARDDAHQAALAIADRIGFDLDSLFDEGAVITVSRLRGFQDGVRELFAKVKPAL
jgi:post-segregation antitoxin (ccd killing protein)